MEFYPIDAAIPGGLHADAFVLHPLRAAHNPLDYEAVMASQEQLRLITSGAWPRPDFTPAENLADLEEHETEFGERRSFTYTVLDPTETRCLGCVYIYPRTEALRRANAADDETARVGDHEAVVWFWVRPDGVAVDLDRRLLSALAPWLRRDFAFARVVFAAYEVDRRQVTVLREAGLRLVWSHPERNTVALHFEWPGRSGKGTRPSAGRRARHSHLSPAHDRITPCDGLYDPSSLSGVWRAIPHPVVGGDVARAAAVLAERLGPPTSIACLTQGDGREPYPHGHCACGPGELRRGP